MADFTLWGNSHKSIASRYLGKENVIFPSDPLEWVEKVRGKIGGKKRSFLVAPFWIPIYEDKHDYVMVMGGRQIFKTTMATDLVAMAATIESGVQICYMTHNQTSLAAFSKQKLRIETFLVNDMLRKILRHPGNVGEISLKNNSTIYMLTDNDQYIHLEGKSPVLCVIDEAQYQNLDYFGRVHQTMMATKGKVRIFGIGGESGSTYEKMWQETNQMEWEYDDELWRDKLEFDKGGLVVGEYLRDVLKGGWIAQNPSAEFFIGYHIPQTILATNPLTKQDAIEKYKTHPIFSIESQKERLSPSEVTANVMGTFHDSAFRPITRAMIAKCTEPYRYLSLVTPYFVREMKKSFGSDVLVSMGVDFGSGRNSSTVLAICMLWRKYQRIHLAYMEKRPQENQIKQAEYISEVFRFYDCDVGVGDLGYGTNQVKLIQDGGYSAEGKKYPGVDGKFYGCRSISNVAKPFEVFEDTVDEHGDKMARVQIDKTASIDELVGMLHSSVGNSSKMIIPSRSDYQTGFLRKDLLSITRKDLDTDILARKRIKKEYNHPPDSVMALIYAITAMKIEETVEWRY